MPIISRRSLLAAAPLLALPGIAFARAATDQRFVLIILRGAMDGLAAVPPVGARLVVGVLPLQGGSGSPVRALALIG